MTMLTLRDTILSVSTKTRVLGKRTLLSEKATQSSRKILTSRVDTKHTNGRIKLSANHGGQHLINREKLTTKRHEVDPSMIRIIINKDHIVSMTPFRNLRSRTTNIRVNKIKRTSRNKITRGIWELQLLAKLTTHKM